MTSSKKKAAKTKAAKTQSPKTLQNKIQEGSANLAAAQQEVSQLLEELNAGTLDRNTLESGLETLQQMVSQLSDHIPTFNPDISKP
jgi:chromosome segregation ATPase